MNIIFESGVWVLWLIYAVASFFFLKNAWKQHTGGSTWRDDEGKLHDAPNIPLYKTTYFEFWAITTAAVILMSLLILGDYF